MFSSKVKKIVAIILIVAMNVTSAGFMTLANSVEPAITIANETETNESTSKYYEVEDLNVEEEATVTKVEEDESTTVEESDENESLAEETELEEDETTTVGEEVVAVDETTGEEETIVEESETTVEESETTVEELETTVEESETTVEESETTAEESETTMDVEVTTVAEESSASPTEETSKTVVKASDIDLATFSDAENVDNKENFINENEGTDIAISIETDNNKNNTKTNENVSTSSDIIEKNLASVSEASMWTSPVSTKSEVLKLTIEMASASDMNLLGSDPLFGALPEYMWMGTYPQNDINGSQKEPIKWKKMVESTDEALYMPDKILDARAYHNPRVSITWTDSDIRAWLNDTSVTGFLGKAFSVNQLDDGNGLIKQKTIRTDIWNGGGSYYETIDKVHLLSSGEMCSMMIQNGERLFTATPYAKNVGVAEYGNKKSPWWLRNFLNTNNPYYVYEDGNVRTDFCDKIKGVFPALYINIDSPLFKKSNNGVTWNLNGGSFNAGSTLWSSMNTYLGGQQLPVANNFTPPSGKYFIGISINTINESTISEIIPNDYTGDITLNAIWGDTAGDKVIGYDLGDANCSDWSVLPDHYTPGIEKPLPHGAAISSSISSSISRSLPGGDVIGWFINDDNSHVYTEIPATMTDNLTLRPCWMPGITYNLGFGNSWKATDSIITIATIGEIQQLPDLTNYKYLQYVDMNNYSYKFDHWEINGVPATEIPAENTQPVTATAIWSRGSFESDGSLFFSMYPQSSTRSEVIDPIKWRIASVSYPYVYLYADKILDNVSYNAGNAVWSSSNIRTWLNDESANGFFGTTFDNPLLASFVTEIPIENNVGGDTTDKVFLLSDDEATHWITDANFRGANGTAYAKNKDNGGEKLAVGTGGRSAYWLRSQGSANTNAKVVTDVSIVNNTGLVANNKTAGVRPVICVNVGNPVFNNFVMSDITWNLNGHTLLDDSTWGELHNYIEGVEMSLPVSGNFTDGTLVGWVVNNDPSVYITKIPAIQTGPITLDALWADVHSRITFNLDGEHFRENFATPSYYTHGTAKPLPVVSDLVIAPGRTFSHWEIEQGGAVINPNATEISNTTTGDVTVVAKYNNVIYNITWDLSDGTSTAAIDRGVWDGANPATTYTHRIGITTLPTNVQPPQGRAFHNWKIIQTDAGGPDIEPATNIDPMQWGNITIKAVYNKVTYNITWDLYDGTSTAATDLGSWDGASGIATYTYGSGIVHLPTNIVPPAGRTFHHYILKQTGSGGADINPATSVSQTHWGNITIKAVYNPITYPVTWNLNGATIDPTLIPSEHTYGTAIPLPAKTSIVPATGRVFDRWLVNGTPATSISANLVGDVIVTLVYKGERKHKITWDYAMGKADEWSFDGYVAPEEYTEGVPVVFPDASKIKPRDDGKEFDYFTVNGAKATEISGNLKTDVIVKAVLKNKEYVVAWDLGKGSLPESEKFITYTYGTAKTLPGKASVIAPEGQEFDYWIIRQAGKADINHATSISATTKDKVTIVAVYKNKTYKITWAMNGATLKTGTLASTYIYGIGLALPSEGNLNMPAGETFGYWMVNGIKATEISATYYLPATVTLVTEKMIIDNTHHITWDYAKGNENEWSFYDFAALDTFIEGVTVILPNASHVKAKNTDKVLDYWKVNGEKATEIVATTKTDVVISIVFKDRDDDYKEVDSISIVTKPTVNYNVNSYFNPAGLVLKVNYIDGSTGNIKYSTDNAYKFAFEPSLNTRLTLNMKKVEIRYRGKDTTLDITVKKDSSSTPPGGGGGGRGGGGGGGGGTLPGGGIGANSVEVGINTPITLNEYAWISTSDESGKKFYGIKILKTSALAKTLMSNSEYAKYYKSLDEEYIQLKNGIFNIQYLNQFFNYAFDFNGNMFTGIITAKEGTKLWAVDETTGTLVESGSISGNKYLFYDGAGEFYGIMWTQPITYNNVEYTFDATGKIISEKAVTNDETVEGHSKVDSWEFDPLNNSWKYFEVDASGNKTYLKNTAKEINSNGVSAWYIFDENGNIKTGLTEYKGNTYYLQETGANRGAITTGAIVLNGISYTFDSAGCMVSKVSALTGTQH